MGSFIADFLCREARIVVEIDGCVHRVRLEYDNWRTKDMEKYGYQVLRFTNEEVMGDLQSVLNRIASHARTKHTHSPSPGERNGRVGEGARG